MVKFLYAVLLFVPGNKHSYDMGYGARFATDTKNAQLQHTVK